MKELNKELTMEIKDYYKKYKSFISAKQELTNHNKAMKSDFVDINFEDEEAGDRKRIKKEITKFFNTIVETDSGSEPVIEVRQLRKDHLDFEDELYNKLMEIYKQFVKNIDAKKAIDERVEKEVYLELCLKIGSHIDVVKGILKVWKETEDGKFPVTLSVADDYRVIVREIDKLGEE